MFKYNCCGWKERKALIKYKQFLTSFTQPWNMDVHFAQIENIFFQDKINWDNQTKQNRQSIETSMCIVVRNEDHVFFCHEERGTIKGIKGFDELVSTVKQQWALSYDSNWIVFLNGNTRLSSRGAPWLLKFVRETAMWYIENLINLTFL